MNKKLILASASPRRRELLTLAGYDHEVVPSCAEEITDGSSAADLVRINALLKAREVFARSGSESVILGADTVVCLGDKILGKPDGEQGAREMLKNLSGSVHEVLTGFAVVSGLGESSGVCETKVFFKELTDSEIDSYIATNECYDKAGAYAIQERACLFVDRVEGDFFNVIGLPVRQVYAFLNEHGIKPNWIFE